MTYNLSPGKALLDAGNLTGARRVANEALEDDVDNLEAWLLLIMVENDAHEFEKALGLLKKSLAKWPGSFELRFLEIIALYKPGKEKICREKVSLYEVDFPLRYKEVSVVKGFLAANQGKIKEARKHASNLENQGVPEQFSTALELQIARASNNMIDIMNSAQHAVDADSTDAKAHSVLAFSQFDLLILPSAIRSAGNALRLDPTQRQPEATFLLIWLLLFPPFLACHLMYMSKGLVPLLPKFVAVILKMLSPLIFLYVLIGYIFPFLDEYGFMGSGVLGIVFFALWPFVRNFIVNRYDTKLGKKAHVSLSGY